MFIPRNRPTALFIQEKMRKVKRKIASAIIVSKDKKVLLLKEDPEKGGVYLDCWHIPGGGLKENETLDQGLFREILEETGIDISALPKKLIDNTQQDTREKTLESGERVLAKMHFHDYLIKINNKTSTEVEVCLNDEIIEYTWVSKKELKSHKLTPPLTKLIKKLKLI
jgi:8-oxo-dGTP pyrophosphatase MutT (NUDIX family)